ncbi:IS21-like element helper ATPase IstB [Catalinimonas niigatensis]|uniref:IS21-like element helper ATPase IstB n=1 Tax=Catalinimonas niigatensis TaxID=1397264 RepID=UPI0026659503|nr:IS21-like element helper ATPase IstB [Catalinimonas niigatensis]WPP51783.1 IS21-like element helper ATPase IstB [Catalinimonas niigatensis]
MNQVENQMTKLKLHGMIKTWAALQESRKLHELSLLDGLEVLLQAEEQERDLRKFKRLEYNAGFRYKASMEELRFDQARGIDKKLLTSLATGEYINKGESILITGATGCGKSFLSSALGHQACLLGFKVAYFNAQKLMLKTKMARLEGTIYKFFEKLAKTDLMILDDFGLTHLEKQQQMDLMEIIEDRHGARSTIIASQLPVASWYDVIGEATIADAILDRLVHTSYRIEIKGESLRKKQ